MRKQPEVENHIKNIIRDELALNPLSSVHKMRVALHVSGYHAASGFFLDWNYIAKLVRKVRTENLVSLSRTTRMARLSALKERHRVLTEKLTPIAEGKTLVGLGVTITPTAHDMITAANTIMKWDTALFFAEEQIGLIDKTQTIEQKRTRAVIMTDTISETRVISQHQNGSFPKRELSSSKTNSPVNKASLLVEV